MSIQVEMSPLETYQVYMIYLSSVILGSIANVFCVVLLIVYFKQGCICSTKKGMNILMCFTYHSQLHLLFPNVPSGHWCRQH